MAATKSAPAMHPDLRQAAEGLAAPIDFDQLIADGVLRKAGNWYEVLDPTALPDHARHKIKALKSGNRVKFRKPSKRLGKYLRALGPMPEANGTPEPADHPPARPRARARA